MVELGVSDRATASTSAAGLDLQGTCVELKKHFICRGEGVLNVADFRGAVIAIGGRSKYCPLLSASIQV